MYGLKRTNYEKQVYENELNDFLPDKIIDAHAHVFLREHRKEETKNISSKWANCVCEECSIENLKQTYLDLFPNKHVVPVIFGVPSGNLDESNAYLVKTIKDTGFPALFMSKFSDSAEYIEKSVLQGRFNGLKPCFYNFNSKLKSENDNIMDFLTWDQLEICNKYGLKVLLRIPNNDKAKNFINLRQLIEIEQKYPNITLILEHIDLSYEGAEISIALELLYRNTKNVILDLSRNISYYAVCKCIEIMGVERVVFGSDIPMAKIRTFSIPKTNNYFNVTNKSINLDIFNDLEKKNVVLFGYENLRAIKRACEYIGLKKHDINKIMFENASKLYGLKI